METPLLLKSSPILPSPRRRSPVWGSDLHSLYYEVPDTPNVSPVSGTECLPLLRSKRVRNTSYSHLRHLIGQFLPTVKKGGFVLLLVSKFKYLVFRVIFRVSRISTVWT